MINQARFIAFSIVIVPVVYAMIRLDANVFLIFFLGWGGSDLCFLDSESGWYYHQQKIVKKSLL